MPPTSPLGGRGRVLLADDDALLRTGLMSLLRADGFDCVGVGSAEEVLALLREDEFEALIADIYMPGNARLELLERLPQVAVGLPVILLTGRPTVETAVDSVNLAVAGYLIKPPKMAELRGLLDKAIEGYRSCRKLQKHRQRFAKWARDLALVEKALREPQAAQKAMPTTQFLQRMSSNFTSLLDDMEQTLGLLVRLRNSGKVFREQELVGLLQRTVGVLEQARQSFKSKRLARLRSEIKTLLGENSAEVRPAAGAEEGLPAPDGGLPQAPPEAQPSAASPSPAPPPP